MYSDIKRKIRKTKQQLTKLHGKINGKKMIMVTLKVKRNRLTTNRATHEMLCFSLQLDCINSAM